MQTALISTLKRIHPTYDEARQHLTNIATFLKCFTNVFCLNYDLIVYWAVTNDKDNFVLKDCFVDGQIFRYNNWNKLYKPMVSRGASSSTLVFYPHGNLALGITAENEKKIIRTEEYRSDLLVTIGREWEINGVQPLFISEGTSAYKRRSILKSHYLRTVYEDVLPYSNGKDSIVVYGLSLEEQDHHLLRQLPEHNANRVAYSIYNGDKGNEEIEEEQRRITRVLKKNIRDCIDIVFFRSDSEGCWIF